MRKITFSFLALLLTAVGAWAQSVTLQPSTTVDSPEFVYYLTNCNQSQMDANTAPTTVRNTPLGRFAFFKVDGKDDTYTIMSVDAAGDNKWLSYPDNPGGTANLVSLVSRDVAKEWKIIVSATTKGKSYASYQFQPYNTSGNVITNRFMNWTGGVNGKTSIGFHTDNAASDAGSAWMLTPAPMSGRSYYIFDKTHNMYLSLTKLKNYGGVNMVTLTSAPEMCKFTADNSNWKISTTADSPIYLTGSGSAAVQGTDEAAATGWILETAYNDAAGEVYLRLRNPAFSTVDASYIGNNAHTEEGKEVWANAPSGEALDFRLLAGTSIYVNATVKAGPYSAVMTLPVGDDLDLSSFFFANGLLSYTNTVVDVKNEENQTFTVECTEKVPFATSFEGLDEGNKWVSFFTSNGRMHVYDDNCEYNGEKKYPCIDRATFAKLTDNKFWGFVCANPLTDYVKIVNKGATKDKGTLFLTKGGNGSPLLFDPSANKVTDEWVISEGTRAQEDGQTVQYYCIKAKGTSQYINNYDGRGFMTTFGKDGFGDSGSNIKFTSEQGTYDLLKERALNAPYNAVNSLTAEARALITGSTVADYKQSIEKIKELDEEGVVKFDESIYYYLRNYTPAGGTTYVLDTKNGTTATTIAATYGLGTASDEMTYFNANALWTIKTADSYDEGYTGGSTDIGISKTIGRKVTHVNSGNKLLAEGSNALSSIGMNETGTTLYFVNLGAGQHFIKNQQYLGNGNQAKAMPIACRDNNGSLYRGAPGVHKKNTRDTWYGIPVTSLYVKLNGGGDDKYYATAHFPFAVSIDAEETVKAYTVESIDKDNGLLNMKEVTGVIPAGTAMILIDENETAKLNILPAVTETAQADAILKGVNMAQAFDADITADNVLVLGIGGTSSKVGFYKPATGSTELRSNSAYIPVSALDGVSAANGLKFNFGGVANGIDGVNADSNKGTVVYDLQGRRVNKLSKGLYIVNGKKVIL